MSLRYQVNRWGSGKVTWRLSKQEGDSVRFIIQLSQTDLSRSRTGTCNIPSRCSLSPPLLPAKEGLFGWYNGRRLGRVQRLLWTSLPCHRHVCLNCKRPPAACHLIRLSDLWDKGESSKSRNKVLTLNNVRAVKANVTPTTRTLTFSFSIIKSEIKSWSV